MQRIRSHCSGAVALGVILLLAAKPSLLAATRAWTGGGGIAGAGWNVAANWTNNILPTNSDDIYFPSSGIQRSTLNNLLGAVHSITFGDDGYSIVGTLVLTNGINCTNTTGANVLPSEIILGDNQSFTNANPATQLAFVLLELAG